MSITDRIEPTHTLEDFLLAYETQRLAFITALDFIKKIHYGYCLNESDLDGLRKLVGYEDEAEKILRDFGEIK